MHHTEFTTSPVNRWGTRHGATILVALGVGLAARAAYDGAPAAALLFLVLGALGGASAARHARHFSCRVALTAAGIAAETYRGRVVRLRWEEVRTLQQWHPGRLRYARLAGADGQGEILLNSSVEGFDELLAQIRARAPHLRHLPARAYWTRLLDYGSP